MIQISNKKHSLTRETLKEALDAWSEKYGKRGNLNACEVVQSKVHPEFVTFYWGSWSKKGSFKELERSLK